MSTQHLDNQDPKTVQGFGDEWSKYDQTGLSATELQRLFERYFNVFRWDLVDVTSVGFDMGCGSGRWARLLAPHVGHLHCVDASSSALRIAQNALRGQNNVSFHHAAVGTHQLAPGTMDFGISLGVLHHAPNTQMAIQSCVDLLVPGGTILLYLYYRFDNRPAWFGWIWKCTNVFRAIVSRLPFRLRASVCTLIAMFVYWPLARLSSLLHRFKLDTSNIPLSTYRHLSFYTMRTDALDRFGTRLERRFTRAEIYEMLKRAGCDEIRFSAQEPYWCVSAVRVSLNRSI